jgi:2-C-methyl-D-erythritol 2,4-cyclodiphosphate synthase
VVIAQKPKLNPHVPAICASIASILEIDPDRVSVKPKTNEGMGFEGRMEGVSVQASVLLTR